jgi:hypothetical protein
MKRNSRNDIDESNLQARIVQLTSKLEAEVSTIKGSQESDLVLLASECSRALKHLVISFDEKLLSLQRSHQERITMIEEELDYLRELSSSQNLMLQNNLDYIKQLEELYNAKPLPGEGIS